MRHDGTDFAMRLLEYAESNLIKQPTLGLSRAVEELQSSLLPQLPEPVMMQRGGEVQRSTHTQCGRGELKLAASGAAGPAVP